MKGIAPKQKQICDFVIRYKIENDGNSPAIDEIAAELGISMTGVSQHINRMVIKGLVSNIPGKTRSLKVNKEMYDSLTKEE